MSNRKELETEILAWQRLRVTGTDAHLKVKHLPEDTNIFLSPEQEVGLDLSKNGLAQIYAGRSYLFLDNNKFAKLSSDGDTSVKGESVYISGTNIYLNNKRIRNRFLKTDNKEDEIISPSSLLLQLLNENVKVVLGEPAPDSLQISISLRDLISSSSFVEPEIKKEKTVKEKLDYILELQKKAL